MCWFMVNPKMSENQSSEQISFKNLTVHLDSPSEHATYLIKPSDNPSDISSTPQQIRIDNQMKTSDVEQLQKQNYHVSTCDIFEIFSTPNSAPVEVLDVAPQPSIQYETDLVRLSKMGTTSTIDEKFIKANQNLECVFLSYCLVSLLTIILSLSAQPFVS